MNVFDDPAPGSKRRWIIFVIGGINFVMSMFYRVSIAVVSTELVHDFGLTSSQLADLSALFFYSFAAAQIPVGMAVDRLGPRTTLALLAVPGVVGSLLFAYGSSVNHLMAARVLLGLGMSGSFMAVLTLIAVWFPSDRFAFLAGIVVSVGVVGNMLAATPLALLSMWMGWRSSFVLFAVVNALVVASFLAVIRDRPRGQRSKAPASQPLFRSLLVLVRMYSYWAISLGNYFRYGYVAALQGLWAGPFLISGLGLDELEASNALFLLALGYMVGLPAFGILSDRLFRSRKWVALPALAICCLMTLYPPCWSRDSSLCMIYLFFLGLGFVGSGGQVFYAHMKDLVPASMTAQAMTSVNLFTITGAATVTQILGLVIGPNPSGLTGPDAFSGIWYVGTVGLALGCILYLPVPDSIGQERLHSTDAERSSSK